MTFVLLILAIAGLWVLLFFVNKELATTESVMFTFIGLFIMVGVAYGLTEIVNSITSNLDIVLIQL